MTAKGLNIFCNALMLLMMSSSCGAAKPDAVNADEPQRDVANEAISQIPSGTIRTLEGKAKNGDIESSNILANHFTINFGHENYDAIKWQLQSARLGNCRHLNDLMFAENFDGIVVPKELLSEGESLQSIAEAHDCL